VRFDVSESGEAEISVSLSSAWRGFGLGAEVIRLASKESRLPRIEARIKAANIASVKAFAKAGYEETGITEVKGQKTIVMVLDKG
jgi:RimJ/RimL family protein N-acetyltransferase